MAPQFGTWVTGWTAFSNAGKSPVGEVETGEPAELDAADAESWVSDENGAEMLKDEAGTADSVAAA